MLTPTIPHADIEHYWNYDSHNRASGRPGVAPGTKSDFTNIQDRYFEALGSMTNRKPFRLFERSLNGEKGKLMGIDDRTGKRIAPVADNRMRQHIDGAIMFGLTRRTS